MEQTSSTILVVGAGPGGMAFALECASHGLDVQIVEQRATRSQIGKATGVAAGVWAQLSRFGIAPDRGSSAIPMRQFAFHDNGQLVAKVPVPAIDGCPPAYLYPQVELERKIEQALTEAGITVTYGVELLTFEEGSRGVEVRVQDSNGNTRLMGPFKWLIGADGAHSRVREIAAIPFAGKEYPENWSVAEIATKQWPPGTDAQLFLQPTGVGLFLSQPSSGVVQGILNESRVTEVLLSHFPDAKLRYAREFNVSLRRVASPRKGLVWLIGDAAHAQSPVGGQGLNLAIWDGITLAKALAKGDLAVEKRLARRAKKVLRFTHFDYRMLVAKGWLLRSLRNRYWKFAAGHPVVAKWFFRIISGLW